MTKLRAANMKYVVPDFMLWFNVAGYMRGHTVAPSMELRDSREAMIENKAPAINEYHIKIH